MSVVSLLHGQYAHRKGNDHLWTAGTRQIGHSLPNATMLLASQHQRKLQLNEPALPVGEDGDADD